MRLEDMQLVTKLKYLKKKIQLEVKSSTKDLFSDLLNKIKGFKYQITLKVMLKKIQTQWKN